MPLKNSKILRCIFVLIISLSAIYILFLYAYNPILKNTLPPCPIYYFAKLYCPGCGTGRSLYALLHGDFIQAFRFNPFFIVILPFLLYFVFCRVFGFIVGRKYFTEEQLNVIWFNIFTFIIFIYFILRNIPFFPFNYLAPTVIR